MSTRAGAAAVVLLICVAVATFTVFAAIDTWRHRDNQDPAVATAPVPLRR